MKKSFIFVLAAVAGLAGIAIGLAAGRSNLIRGPKTSVAGAHTLPTHAMAAVKNVASQQSGQMAVVRFASNPQLAPPFLVRDIDGNVISTAEWKDKVVLVNFWATWCPPCREEVPEMISLQRQFGDKLLIVGVSEDDDGPANVMKFAMHSRINYPIVMATQEVIAAYGGVPALPTTFVIDTQGRVVTKHAGLHP